jgi:hypothetical protein
MVVMMMLEQEVQSDRQNCHNLETPIFLQLLNDLGERSGQLSVAVKTLATTGVILDIQHLGDVLINDMYKGQNVLLQVYSADGGGQVELPGKILWIRNNSEAVTGTLGLELLGPLPLSIRHALENSMSIGAKDMKVLWDYWDETNDTVTAADLSEASSFFPNPEACEAFEELESSIGKEHNWAYWIGFATILSGLAMQLPQSEYLGLYGLLMMFGGSLAVAWKSVMRMRHIFLAHR